MEIDSLLKQTSFCNNDLVSLLTCTNQAEEQLFAYSKYIRDTTIGNSVHMRGLVEISNICIKDCLYCGIRRSNNHAQRYSLTDEEILNAASFAHRYQYGSIVLQGGERKDKAFTERIEQLLLKIKKLSNNTLGITLSLGEQNKETLQRWKSSGTAPSHWYPQQRTDFHPDHWGRYKFFLPY